MYPSCDMFLAKVFVQLRPTVNDPQGQTITGSLHNLGFESVSDLRYGKYMEIKLTVADRSTAEKQVHEMCQRLLANPVIEQYGFELEEVAAGEGTPRQFT